MMMNYHQMRHGSKCSGCNGNQNEEKDKKWHNPNRRRCPDFFKYLARLKIIRRLAWGMKAEDWRKITQKGNLKLIVMRLMKATANMSQPDGEIIKASMEMVTIVMRMEQSSKNGGRDELRMELCIKKIRNLYNRIKRKTNFVTMRTIRKKWMLGIIEDMGAIFRRHTRRIYLEGRRMVLKKMLEKEVTPYKEKHVRSKAN